MRVVNLPVLISLMLGIVCGTVVNKVMYKPSINCKVDVKKVNLTVFPNKKTQVIVNCYSDGNLLYGSEGIYD